MARKFREARQMKKLKVIEAAALLGVSQPTLSAWEGGRKSPTIDNLLAMAELYGVTTDYLLGRTEAPQGASSSSPLTAETLRIRNGQPVWSPSSVRRTTATISFLPRTWRVRSPDGPARRWQGLTSM